MEATKSIVKDTNDYFFTSEELKQLLLQGKNINYLNVIEDEEIELFKKYQTELLNKTIVFLNTDNKDISHEKNSNIWHFPEEYQTIDVKKWLINKCKTQEEIDRVNEEYDLYEKRNLIMLLRLLIFLVDHMRKNKFVWGVGRGSSVNSFCLYLIGVHRVNSLRYSLSINDYLK